MPFSRYTESQLRKLIDIIGLVEPYNEAEVAIRLQQLQRGLEPEDEFALLLSWLGKCKLVHKLGQEQLPLNSIENLRVPDLLAVFEYNGKDIPVLIEVKKTSQKDQISIDEGTLSLKAGYLEYANIVGLPMLIAWKHASFWTLFEMRHAKKAITNYKMRFFHAMEENLLGLLADDFSYRVAPGTSIVMHIKKLTEPDEHGSFKGRIDEAYLENLKGVRIPEIPYLSSLFLIWDSEIEQQEGKDHITQRFFIPDVELGEFASRTLGKLVTEFTALKGEKVNWRAIIHDTQHWSHQRGQFRKLVEEGAKHGVFKKVFKVVPHHQPKFL